MYWFNSHGFICFIKHHKNLRTISIIFEQNIKPLFIFNES